MPKPTSPFVRCFSEVEDPRIDRNKKHLLTDIIVIVLCGVPESGALLLREAGESLRLARDMAAKLKDDRDASVHTFPELLCTAIMLPALGWRDQDDADFLRHDAALRVAVSDDRGVTPLADDGKSPGGLASQPTLSRLHEALSTEHNRGVVRSFLLESSSSDLESTTKVPGGREGG
jgi:hypothetical protein